MAAGLYLLISEALPELPQDEDEHILVDVRDEADSSDDQEEEDFAPTDYCCMTTLVTNCAWDEELRSLVVEWWHEMAGVQPVLELLADSPFLMSADQRESLADLQPESWSIRTPLVLYRRGSREAEAEARRFVIECAVATH